MADIKISEMNNAAALNGSELIPIVQSGANVKSNLSSLRTLLSASGDLAYNSTTGEFSFIERTDAEVRGLLSASGDLAYNSTTGEFSVTTFKTQDARNSISVTNTGGDGSLTYDSNNGVISYTGPSASDVRAHFSSGTGIDITDGVVALDSNYINQSLTTTSDVAFSSSTVGAGTETTPTFAFTDRPNTGTFLNNNENYAITVLGNKVAEFESSFGDGNYFEILNQDDDIVFSVGDHNLSEPIFEVFSTTETSLFSVTETSISIDIPVDIDSTLTFANGSIENVVSDVSAGEGTASSSAIKNMILINASDYESLVSPDPDTLYVITD